MQIEEQRTNARAVLGDKYEATIAAIRPIIEARMAAATESPLEAAGFLADGAPSGLIVCLLFAAAAEIIHSRPWPHETPHQPPSGPTPNLL